MWAARDRITGRTVALKTLSDDADERAVQALVREAVALSGVEGLGVPRVQRFGRLAASSTQGGRSYLVRDLVDGDSLADLIERRGDALAHLDTVAKAADQLTRLHRASLLHGDVKPANIIAGSDGRATLVDLGLAATWRDGGAPPVGLTPRYAAPELFVGAALTVRAEVYALGASVGEIVAAEGRSLAPHVKVALEEVIARATAKDPEARYPSADELASALRRAAGIATPEPVEHGVVWPVLGLDDAAAELLDQISHLRPGGGIVLLGPQKSGRSTLLRRIAWSLGVERPVAWIESAAEGEVATALGIELAAVEEDPRGLCEAVVLVDDAERLGSAEFTRLGVLHAAGARLVLVLGSEAQMGRLPEITYEIFQVPRLSTNHARELLRRTAPSLSDAVVSHILDRADGWPGRVRDIVTRIAGVPVITPQDVDRITASIVRRAPARTDLIRLLDQGHIDEAAVLLAHFDDDSSPDIAIARSRVLVSRGDASGAIAELERARARIPSDPTTELSATFCLAWARAHLRAGQNEEAERSAREAALGLIGDGAEDDAVPPVPAAMRSIAAELVAVCGVAQSFSGRHDEAKATLGRAVRLAEGVNEPRIRSITLGSLAFVLHRDDRLTEAKAAYEAALVAGEQAGDAGTIATTRLNLAAMAKTQGDLAGAILHFEAAVDMGRRSGRRSTLQQALLNLANLDLFIGRLARARVSIDSLAQSRSDLMPFQRAQLLGLEAEYAARSGDLVLADRLCLSAAEAYGAEGRRLDEAEARLERVLYGAACPNPHVTLLSAEIERTEPLLGGGSAHGALLDLARGRVLRLAGDETKARLAYDQALSTAQASGQRDWVWRALEARAELEDETGQPQKARRDREAALLVLEEISERLPRDLREVFWNDPRRKALRTASHREMSIASTQHSTVGEDRLARVLEINRAIAGEHDLPRLLEKVTDHAIALLRAEHGFVILRSGYARDTTGSLPRQPPEAPPASAPPSSKGDYSIHASRDRWGDDPHARFSQSIAEKVISTGTPVVTASARDDALMASFISVHQLMLQSVACVPIRARSSYVIGALYLETRLRPTTLFADQLPTLLAFADQVAIAIENARLVGENTRRAVELEKANGELEAARAKLEELLGHRTEELAATRRDLRSARAVLGGHFGYEGLVGTSEAMRRVYALIDRVRELDVPVLILGESGTGKEMVARAIHNAGPTAKEPFVGINCGAIPEHLLESELFGHVRGAFSGADRDRKGLFREAGTGSILLDEIGEMPQKMQAGLLRVLQEKVARPVGGSREEPVHARILTATHRDLSTMVTLGTFREDLYYRLHVIEVRVPALRDRLEDLPILIDHFLGIFVARYGRERRSVSRASLKRLASYNWPGNVRQLENVLLNAWLLSDGPELEPEDFELPAARPSRPSEPHAGDAPSEVSADGQKTSERERILDALARANWNRVKAAEILGMARRTFYRRLKDHGIQ